MSLAAAGAPYGFNYVAADQALGLFIQATIYDITTGSPGVQVSQVPLFAAPGLASPGSYFGVFTPAANKAYAIVTMVYLDSGYTTLDPDRAPGCETVQSVTIAGGAAASVVGVFVNRGKVVVPVILRGVVIDPPILRGKIYC